MNSTTAFVSGSRSRWSASTLSTCARRSSSSVLVVGGGSGRNCAELSSTNGFTLNQCGVRNPGVKRVPSGRVNVIGCQRSGSTIVSAVLTGA